MSFFYPWRRDSLYSQLYHCDVRGPDCLTTRVFLLLVLGLNHWWWFVSLDSTLNRSLLAFMLLRVLLIVFGRGPSLRKHNKRKRVWGGSTQFNLGTHLALTKASMSSVGLASWGSEVGRALARVIVQIPIGLSNRSSSSFGWELSSRHNPVEPFFTRSIAKLLVDWLLVACQPYLRDSSYGLDPFYITTSPWSPFWSGRRNIPRWHMLRSCFFASSFFLYFEDQSCFFFPSFYAYPLGDFLLLCLTKP